MNRRDLLKRFLGASVAPFLPSLEKQNNSIPSFSKKRILGSKYILATYHISINSEVIEIPAKNGLLSFDSMDFCIRQSSAELFKGIQCIHYNYSTQFENLIAGYIDIRENELEKIKEVPYIQICGKNEENCCSGFFTNFKVTSYIKITKDIYRVYFTAYPLMHLFAYTNEEMKHFYSYLFEKENRNA